MTTWAYGISWSKFKMALECEEQLRFAVEKETPTRAPSGGYYQELGKKVQRVFELYFNQKINQRPNGQEPESTDKVIRFLLGTKDFLEPGINFTPELSRERFRDDVYELSTNGFQFLRDENLLQAKFQCEKGWPAVFRNHSMYGMLDFYGEEPDGVTLLDGKATKEMNADPRQILYYALMIAATGRKIKRAGFLYFRFGLDLVDCSPTALRAFIDGEFSEGRKIFDRLKGGTDQFVAQPENQRCRWCNWNGRCKFNAAGEPPPLPERYDIGEVDLG